MGILYLPEVPTTIATGRWDDITTWEFVLHAELPPVKLCTAVACLAIAAGSGDVLLALNQRGWVLPGGHIEPGETIDEALQRETLEEGGFIPEESQLFGYLKMLSTEPVPHRQRPGFYPHPHDYIPHYVSVIDQALVGSPSGPEIYESRWFAQKDIPKVVDNDLETIIFAGLAARAGPPLTEQY